MRQFLILGLLFVIFTVLTVPSAQAQYFKFDNLTPEQVQSGVIEIEVDAILKFFGSIVGGGLYHTADLHSVGGIDVGLRGVIAVVPDEFDDLPVFSEENLVGLAFLHGSLGLPGNFELLGRFFYFPVLGSDPDENASPPRAADSRGGVTLIGGGLKYGLLQIPGVPKIMVLGAYHVLLVPEEFDFGTVSTVSLKGVVSHSVPLLTVYAGGGIDITTLKLKDDIPILGGDRSTGSEPLLTLGVQIKPLPLIHVNGSYNFSEFPSFELGVGISFR